MKSLASAPSAASDDDTGHEIIKSWIYLGSANLSPSAWYLFLSRPLFLSRLMNLNFMLICPSGRGNKVVMDRARKKAKMIIRNWECGVVLDSEKVGFGKDSWEVLKRFMELERSVPVTKGGGPWILEEAN